MFIDKKLYNSIYLPYVLVESDYKDTYYTYNKNYMPLGFLKVNESSRDVFDCFNNPLESSYHEVLLKTSLVIDDVIYEKIIKLEDVKIQYSENGKKQIFLYVNYFAGNDRLYKIREKIWKMLGYETSQKHWKYDRPRTIYQINEKGWYVLSNRVFMPLGCQKDYIVTSANNSMLNSSNNQMYQYVVKINNEDRNLLLKLLGYKTYYKKELDNIDLRYCENPKVLKFFKDRVIVITEENKNITLD